jgi:hypothetical protein
MSGIQDIRGNTDTKGVENWDPLRNRNCLICKLTGKKRITNNSYLRKRLKALEISEEEFRKYYLSEESRERIKAVILAQRLPEAILILSDQLGPKESHIEPSFQEVRKIYAYHGKNKLFLRHLDAGVEEAWPELREEGPIMYLVDGRPVVLV